MLSRYLSGAGLQLIQCQQRVESFDNERCIREMSGAGAVVNLLGLAHSSPGQRSEAEYERINARFPEALAKCALTAGVASFVHISSVKAAAYNPAKLENDEADDGLPDGLYGRSKRSGECNLLALDWANTRLAILRPALVYGPGVLANLKQLLQATQAGWLPVLEPTGARTMLGGQDFCRAVHALIEAPQLSHQLYIAASRKAYSVTEIQREVRALQGKQGAGLRLSTQWLQALAKPIDVIAASFHGRQPLSERLHKVLQRECYSAARLQYDTGWQAQQDLLDSLPDMLAQPAANSVGTGP